MRLLITILIIAILSGIAEWFFPWWSIAIVAGITAYRSRLGTGRAFLAGFCGTALLWLAYALYHDVPNQHLLSAKLAQLFHLPSYILYIVVTIIVGGLVGGLSAWSGAQLRRISRPATPSV